MLSRCRVSGFAITRSVRCWDFPYQSRSTVSSSIFWQPGSMSGERPRNPTRRIGGVMIRWLIASLLLALVSGAHAADPAKVLRIASPDIDTLDPQNYTDDPSFQIIQALFEPA